MDGLKDRLAPPREPAPAAPDAEARGAADAAPEAAAPWVGGGLRDRLEEGGRPEAWPEPARPWSVGG